MASPNSVKVELFVKPGELAFILKVLDAFRQKKVLDFKLPQKENEPGFSYEKYITEGAPLSEKELLELVDEAENSENLTPEEFKQALAI